MTPNDKLPEDIQEQIKQEAKAYMHAEIKGMVGDDELQPSHLEYAHEAGATEWAQWKVRHDELLAQAQRMADALKELIEIKCLKAEFGKTEEYLKLQPSAWAKAVDALKQFKDGKIC